MSNYQPNKQAKKYPFTDRAFALGLTGTAKANGKEPNLTFSSNKEGKVFFNGMWLAAGDKHHNFSVTYKQFGVFLGLIRKVSIDPTPDEIVVTMVLKFPKGGVWNNTGTSITVGRNKRGVVYFVIGNKDIENVYFKITEETDTEIILNKEPADAKVNSEISTVRFLEHYNGRLKDWVKEAIANGEVEQSASSNNNGWKPQSNNSGNDFANDNAGANKGDDYDDEIPF